MSPTPYRSGLATGVGIVLLAGLVLAIADVVHTGGAPLQVLGAAGLTPMALYRHVDDKNALLDGLVEMLLTEYPLPRAGGEWDERLTALRKLGVISE